MANPMVMLNMDGNGISKVPLKTQANIFGAPLDVLWISNNGAISFNSLNDNNLDSVTSNMVFAALWGTASDGSVPSSGKVFYRSVTAAADLAELTADINLSSDVQSIGNDFSCDSAFQLTYKNVLNPLNSDEKNQYQMSICRGTFGNSSVEKIITIFNYHLMEWVPDGAELGIFAAADESEHCHAHLKDENQNLVTVGDLSTGSNIGEPGKWIMIHSTDLECQDLFETECPEVEEGSRASMSGFMGTLGNNDPDNWEFYAVHQCIPGHHISANVDSRIAVCEYDPDYYDARWSEAAPTCVGKLKSKI